MPTKPKPIDDALKAAIKKSGISVYALSKESGVDQSVISRFMADPGEAQRGGDLRLSTAARLAAALGLELRPAGK